MEIVSTLVGAILLDTRSIQKYVFSCNQLKTNIGASHLIDTIFTSTMMDVLKASGLNMPDVSWKETEKLCMQEDSHIQCEVAYIGGGNMLILVREQEELDKNLSVCRKIVSAWSTRLLIEAPGLHVGAAVGGLDIAEEKFKNSLDILYEQLKKNQNTIFPQVDLPYTGLTVECDFSGKTANIRNYDYLTGEVRMISAETQEKINSEKRLQQSSEYKEQLNDEYSFASELDTIGYKTGESYVCVVHIDGNNMGIKFSKCKDMQERKKLSQTVATIVKKGFIHLLKKIINDYNLYKDKYLLLGEDEGKKILPIRPIIIGGDDVTFICPGRVGIQFAKWFIEDVNKEKLLDDDLYQRINEEFQEKADKGEEPDCVQQTMSCCGGVAIVPAKYPFYRAYELAEQLCSSAKKLSRKDDSSLIDFAVLHGQMTPQLSQLETWQYDAPCGYLHFGPYMIGKKEAPVSLDRLLSLRTRLFDSVPQNKVKKLREVLHQDEHSMQLFLENCREMRELLQHKSGISDVSGLWETNSLHERVTRYVDAIEIEKFVIPEWCEEDEL